MKPKASSLKRPIKLTNLQQDLQRREKTHTITQMKKKIITDPADIKKTIQVYYTQF